MATYGLRACEIVTLTIDDVEWRAERLRVPQRKTRGSLWLPLTDATAFTLRVDTPCTYMRARQRLSPSAVS